MWFPKLSTVGCPCPLVVWVFPNLSMVGRSYPSAVRTVALCAVRRPPRLRVTVWRRIELITLILNRLGGWRSPLQFDFSGTTPLFRQVAEQISEAIVSGAFAEGKQVPSTTEISATYGINPATVLKGMNLLVDQGLLEKRRGLGTFVAVGAQAKARNDKREELLSTQIVELVAQAKALGISSEQLQRIIERNYR